MKRRDKEDEQRIFTLKCKGCGRTTESYMKLLKTCKHCGHLMVDAEYWHW